jgi:cyclophilin family peptidyl-prolyl cis-trans isomerase
VPSDKRARQRAAREARLAAEAQRQKRRKQIRNGVIVVIVAGVIIGIVFLVSGAKTRVNTQTYPSAPAMTIDTSKTYTATVKTTTGTFDIALDAKTAPTTVNNFVFLADKGYYHCVIFHRVIPQFMDQTGDPTGTGSGGPGYTIKDENPPKAANAAEQYPLGSVAMANTGAPNSGGSQFFVVAGPEGESLANDYALFGSVTSGMNVVDTINQQGNPSQSAGGVPPDVTQRIISVTIHDT